ncbi:MAG: hypothetical protein M3456_04150 [Actinomycetota bacterium]|nr:hypothetical protein [Actinomycetota bacterium]
MEIPKQQILEFVPGGSDQVGRAAELLPECVDIERDARLLSDFGIDVSALLGQFNGGVRNA